MGLTWRLEGVHDGVEKLEYYKIRQEWKIDGVGTGLEDKQSK